MEFEDIIRSIGFFSRESFLKRIIPLLKYSEGSNNIPFWHLLLLLKWVLYYGKNSGITILDKGFNDILNGIEVLESKHSFYKFTNENNLQRTMRILANQQFYLQLRIWKDSFARNIVLFMNMDDNNFFQTSFKKITNIEIIDFIRLLQLTWLYTEPEQLYYKPKLYKGIIRKDFWNLGIFLTNENTTKDFINILQLTPNNAKSKIEAECKMKSGILQSFEVSIFTKYPFFKYNGNLFLLHKNLLNTTVNHYFYDTFKVRLGKDFTDKFGKVLEDYIESGLKELSIKYLRENNLKKIFPNSKCVDFVVDDSILIESKAIELSQQAGTNPTEATLYKNFDGNVIYAYTMQILSIANKLPRNLDKEFFGIIITYKEMHWCNGLDCWDDLLKIPTIESCKNNNLDSSILPPENLYFIDIATWDKLIQIIKDTNVTLREILVKAKQDDSVSATKKGAFYLHTNQYDVGRLSLSYLNEPYKILDIDEGNIASKKSLIQRFKIFLFSPNS